MWLSFLTLQGSLDPVGEPQAHVLLSQAPLCQLCVNEIVIKDMSEESTASP